MLFIFLSFANNSFAEKDTLAPFFDKSDIEIRKINDNRLASWNLYNKNLQTLKKEGFIELPFIPKECVHNAHMFYIKCKNIDERTALIKHLKQNEIASVFHYIPLHSAKAGEKFGRFNGEDKYTTIESERLLRLPLYYNIKEEDILKVTKAIISFYGE